jgi:hypothetical protein
MTPMPWKISVRRGSISIHCMDAAQQTNRMSTIKKTPGDFSSVQTARLLATHHARICRGIARQWR